MGYATPIRAVEQVEYRLAEDCGCDRSVDAQVEYRLAGDRDLRWIGSGLAEVGLVAGGAVEVDAARALMDGRDPRSGEQLVRRKRELDPRGKVPARVVVDAITAEAAADGMTTAEYLGTPGLASRIARAERGIVRDGEAHLLPLDDAERLAAAAGLSAERLYGEDVLTEARKWSGHHVDVGLRGVDITVDLPKSISVAHALGGEELAAAIEEEWLASVGEAVGALEEWVAYGMSGHHGDGERAERVATSGLLGWTTLHRSARPVDDSPGDPHLHAHVNIAHLAKGEDGTWRTIAAGGEDLHRYARVTNEIAEARLRARLIEHHGARFEQSPSTGSWELVGVDEALRTAFSRRHQQVIDLAGKDASREQQKAAARVSAEAKEETNAAAPRENWRTRAAAVLGSDDAVDRMMAAALPGPDGPTPALSAGGSGPRMPSPQQLAVQVWDAEHGLTASKKTVSHTHVMAAVAAAAPYLSSAGQLSELTEAVLAVDGHAVRLKDSNRHHHTHRQRYTHSAVIEAEQTVIEAATAGLDAGLAQLTAEAAEMTLDAVEVSNSTPEGDFRFSEQQRAVVKRLLTDGHAVDAVIGVAGAGKTMLMAAARTGWEAAGLRVVGASTAAVAAANLAAEAGIESQTIAAWTREINGGKGLAGVGVLVIDENAMVDDRALAVLLKHASRTGTKVAGVGDPLQLRAVGIGGGFQRIHQLVDGPSLTENRRQRDVVERAALQDWREGGRTTALAAYAGHGRVHADDTSTEALTSMLGRWNEVRTRWEGDPHGQVADLLLLAARRADVEVLNAGARAVRVQAGELEEGRTYALAGGGRLTFAAGDLVHIRRNDYRSRRDESQPDILNGFRGVVLDVDRHQGVLVEWRRPHPGGGHHTRQAWMSDRDIAEGRLTHGYAMTIGSAQGLTSDVTLTYGLHADAHSIYPALSRARQESHLHLPLNDLEDDVTRIRLGDPRSDTDRLDRAVAAYGRQMERDADDGMVTDELLAHPPFEDEEFGQRHAARQQQIEALREQYTDDHPAPTPGQRDRLQELLQSGYASRSAAVPEPEFPDWQERRFGAVATPKLDTRIAEATSSAEHHESVAADCDRRAAERESALAAPVTPGQALAQEARAVLDQADALVLHAQKKTDHAADAEQAATKAAEVRDTIAEKATMGRLALRLAGTSRKEARTTAARYDRKFDAATAQGQQARTEAADAAREAWQIVRAYQRADIWSEYGATGHGAPRGLTELRERLEQMRRHVPVVADRLDTSHAQDAAYRRGKATEARTTAVGRRTAAHDLQTERALRQEMQTTAPQQHAREVAERSTALRQAREERQAQQAAQRARMAAQERNRAAYQPPSQGRSGPSLGR